MDLRFTPEEVAFRDEVRAFLRANLPPELATKVRQGLRLTRDDMAHWHAILHARGWLARDRKSTRLNSSHIQKSRMPSSA